MCLVTNEGRAPACTAGPPLRLPRPPAASLQVAGEGAARRWPGAGGRAARGPGRRPAAERAQRRSRLLAFRRLLSPPKRGRKEGTREGRKRGRRGLTRWKVQAEAPSACGCTGRRATPRAAGWPGARGDGWGRFACVFLCASAQGPGRDMCVWAVHCGELGLRLYVCSLKWVERWPVPGMFHDVVQPQEGG